MITVNNTTRSF